MDLEQQLLFLFSALGAFNGFFLSIYFAFFSKKKLISNYFLAALLLMLSIRIIKSVFFYFNPNLSEVFIQIGLSACVLIGPFLYLYSKAIVQHNKINSSWMFHVIPAILIVTILGLVYPYWSYKRLWSGTIVRLIYLQWLIYIVITGICLKDVLKKLVSKNVKIKDLEIWMISIFVGVTIIWIGYNIGSYTSYIVGAFSFSFVFYLLVLFWVFRRKKNFLFFEEHIKYANKKIHDSEAESLQKRLDDIIVEKELFKNSNLKLNDVAGQLNIVPHYLSQFLNDNLNKSFSVFINEYRIEEAKRLLLNPNNKYTTEAIGYECGFNSKSTFFTTFKKITGVTPTKFKNNANP